MLISNYLTGVFEAGCDEAGRGCLAGPVYAAAVIFPPGYSNPDLDDSKKLSAAKRYHLRPVIETESLAWAVASVDHKKIDELNILRASIFAMHIALGRLKIKPEHILVDGNRFYPYAEIPYKCIIHGDARYASIAAASILAKTYRDDYMITLHQHFKIYGWNQNKGYPTASHRKAIEIYGISPFHRKSFTLLKKQLNINF